MNLDVNYKLWVIGCVNAGSSGVNTCTDPVDVDGGRSCAFVGTKVIKKQPSLPENLNVPAYDIRWYKWPSGE